MLIRLENVTKFYPMGCQRIAALQGITLDIERGDFVAIMGASGSGKSTLLNLLGCLDRASEGSYRLDEEDVTRLSADALAALRNRKIGFVFQNFNLLPRTSALENVELPLYYAPGFTAAKRRHRATELLTRLGLSDRLHHHPNQLSGGQQQRVAIARALVNRPPLILADEPTGNLDSHAGAEIMALFKELNSEGITLVMVTHEPDIAAYARHTVHMRDGVMI